MVDKNIKKIKIKRSDLPTVMGNNDFLDYSFRYRVISEDKNRTSHWSSLHSIVIPDTGDETGFDPNDPSGTSIPHQVIATKSRHVVECSWTMPALMIVNPTDEQKILQERQAAVKQFDVYVQWETSSVWSEWVWVGTTNITQFSMNYTHGVGAPDHIKFRVQKVTLIKQAFDAATYLISSETEL